MKKLTSTPFITTTVGLLFFTFNLAYSQSGKLGGDNKTGPSKDNICLEISGIAVSEYDLPLEGARVVLYQQNEEKAMIEITNVKNENRFFSFNLERNQNYTIEVSKPGYVSRRISVSTHLPADVKISPVFYFEFEIDLFREKMGMDDYYLDFPVALVSYDKKRDVFDIQRKYTENIKMAINKAMENIGKSAVASN